MQMVESLILSLIVGASIGGAAAYLGSLMLSRRMALVGDALGHVALPGMGLALLLGMDVSLGAFVFLAIGIYLTWQLGERTVLSAETLVGIVFVSSLALGFIIVPQPELLESLIGDISKVSVFGAVLAVAVAAGVIILVHRIFSGMILLSISPDLASVQGISAKRYNLLYLSAVALIVSIGVKVTGSLLVGALVIVPPATARIVSRSLREYSRNSMLMGVVSCVAGVLLGRVLRFPAGPSIILVGAVLFVLALATGASGNLREPRPK